MAVRVRVCVCVCVYVPAPCVDELLDLPPVAADEPLVTPVVAKHILGQAAAQLVVLASLVLHGKVRAQFTYSLTHR